MNKLQPYQYHAIVKYVDDLINAYQSVNDQKTVAALQWLTQEKIGELLAESEFDTTALTAFYLDKTVTKAKAEKFFATQKELVAPFVAPTNKQVEKVFRKVKKLKVPEWSTDDLRELSYLGWNDPGSQRKYLLYRQNGELKGKYGYLSPNSVKNICAICHKTSQVALFLATTKTAGDGTYTKKGNYICVDSHQCNRQLHRMTDFEQFVAHLE